MNVWSNGEPEIIQYGTSVLGKFFPNREECEISLHQLTDGQGLKQEKAISGITRANIVYRSRDKNGRVDQEYSCLEINFKNSL